MPAHPADGLIYRDLLGEPETAALFTDSAEIRAMLLVEGALARVQGELGLIPAEAAAFIDRASREVLVDPASRTAGVATDGVPVPGLVAAFRKAAGAPELMQYLHWGATSQDIADTGLALRLRRVLDLWQGRLEALLGALAGLAEAHAELPMAARTYGQTATPTSFGALVAGWGRPLIALRDRLGPVREGVLRVSLSGAAGTLSAMGPRGPEVRAGLAAALDLADPGHSWHAQRDGMAGLAGWMAGVLGATGKLGEDLILLTQSGINEVRLAGGGGSSTMPQKENPVGPSVLVALARFGIALAGVMQGATLHRQSRDGAAWFQEWLALPQLCLATGRSLALAADLCARLTPDPPAMAPGLEAGGGVIHAEALAFALASHMPRPEAQAVVKDLSRQAQAGQGDLLSLARARFPALAIPQGTAMLGTAPAEARAFAAAARNG